MEYNLAPNFLPLIKALWLPMTMLVLVQGVRFGWFLYRRKRLAASGIAEIDGMDGRAFEEYLEMLFVRLGYHVERTRYRGDWGGDLVLEKDGVRTVVQAKRHVRNIGVKAVQEAVAAKPMYGCTGTMVVTNSRYTDQAIRLARANAVTLWDRNRLVEALLSVRDQAA